MPLTSFGPQQAAPIFSGLTYPLTTPANIVVTTATTPVTGTVTQLLGGLLLVDCQDAGTWTTPTAALINAAIQAPGVGRSFEVDVVNYGDTTLTIGLGTGVTKTTIATVAPVLTIVTLASKRLRFVCTGVANGSDPTSADAWVVYAFGSTAAAVA
jgi:hypothetical protein